jgi:predicted oxidoreductase
VAAVTVAPPPLTREKRLEALKRANEVRTLRSHLKRVMTRDRAVMTVKRPPKYAETMTVHALLVSVPKLGPVKANRIMVDLGISHRKTLGGLSDRQRRVLAQELGA